ncbi:MAG: hypothetical protein AAFS10_26105 [Myxococcota bacterium]
MWSILRGLGYLFITFEVTSLSLQHFLGTELSPKRTRLMRWSAGLAFLLGDALAKLLLLDVIRQGLAANFTPLKFPRRPLQCHRP